MALFSLPTSIVLLDALTPLDLLSQLLLSFILILSIMRPRLDGVQLGTIVMYIRFSWLRSLERYNGCLFYRIT